MGLTAIVVLLGVFLRSLNGQSASPERHSLYYVYTALSKPIEAPGIYEFIGMGVLDGRKIDYYNSVKKMKIPQQNWMKEKLPADYWEKGTQSRKSKEQWFKVNVNILMERNRQNGSDVHVLNWKHGCEVEKQPDGSFKFIRGADEYSYDGQDFLAFDDASMQWVAPVPEALPTKQKWDGVPILNQYTKGYLEKECVDWLEKFVTYADGDLIAASPPEVHLFARTSKSSADMLSMTCLATGFLPKEIEMSIRKKETPVYTAQHHHIYPNGDGTHQARLRVDVPKSEADDYDCYVFHRTLTAPAVSKWKTSGIVCDESSSPIGAIVGALGGVAVVAALVGIITAIYLKRKGNQTAGKKPEQAEEQLLKDSREGSQDFVLDLGNQTAGKKPEQAEEQLLKDSQDGSQDSGLDSGNETVERKPELAEQQHLKGNKTAGKKPEQAEQQHLEDSQDGSQDSGLDSENKTVERKPELAEQQHLKGNKTAGKKPEQAEQQHLEDSREGSQDSGLDSGNKTVERKPELAEQQHLKESSGKSTNSSRGSNNPIV